MAKKPEAKLQEQCLDYVKELSRKGEPIVAINQHGSAYGSRGVPDIIMCIKGFFVAVELKVGDNEPTALQNHWLEKITDAGGDANVCYNMDDFKRIISGYILSDDMVIDDEVY